MSAFIRSDVLGDLRDLSQFFTAMPEVTSKAVSLAMNDVSERKAVPAIRRETESQVAFPKGYLDSPDRLGVTKRASPNNLEVVITARDRPTSLARFAPGQTPENTRGKPLYVQVKRGRTVRLNKAFMVRLKNGNIGLAVRLKPGESLRNKTDMKAVALANNVYLLYGPSVDQVFRTVADSAAPEIGTQIGNEFYRQFARLSRSK